MKKILSFKLFENNNNWSEKVPFGFEYSERDIVDILIDLSDNLDFEIDEITHVYLDEEFEHTKDLQDSTYSGYMVGLKKPKLIDTDPRPYSSGFEFTNGTVEFEIYKELQLISPRFDKFFQNLSFDDDDGWYLGLYLLNEVIEEEKLQLVEIQKREEAHQKLERVFSSFYRTIKESNLISPLFKRKMFENKVGESGYGFRGSVKSGFLILPINTTGLSKVVIKNNLPKVESFLRGLNAYNGEFRIITQQDLQQLLDGVKKTHPKDTYYTLEQLKERHEGLYGFIVKFDYEKCIKELI